jgi:hypothetical protein
VTSASQSFRQSLVGKGIFSYTLREWKKRLMQHRCTSGLVSHLDICPMREIALPPF